MEVIVVARRFGETLAMASTWRARSAPFAPLGLWAFAALAVGAGGCSEGFEGSVWSNDDGTRVLTLYEEGASWEERYVDATSGARVLRDGLRFEGTFTETDDAIQADVRCVRADNAQLAEPCDTTVARELTCTLTEATDAKVDCVVGEAAFTLVRESARRVTR